MYRLRDLIKKEYYLLISRDSGSIVFSASNSLYLLVPAEIRQRMERDFKVNFKKDKDKILVKCDLVMEPNGAINLVYSFWRKE